MSTFRLINGVNVTNSDENMWLIPFTPEKSHIVSFEFPQPVTISGIQVWNYNKNPEDTYRGVSYYFFLFIIFSLFHKDEHLLPLCDGAWFSW